VDVRATNGLVVVCFDRFEVNLRTGDVHRNGTPVTLQEQPLRILIRLLEAPGEIVTRDNLRACLWATDTFVDFEHGLNTAIKRLRDPLGDSATEPRFIETIPHRGYRFVATVTTDAASGSTGVSRRLALSRAIAALLVAIAAIAAAWQFARGRAGAAAPAATAGQSIAPAAYGAYMQGLVASHRWQAGGCVDAETHLLAAIAIDPSAADAYAQLAFCYVCRLDRVLAGGACSGRGGQPRAGQRVARSRQLLLRPVFDGASLRAPRRPAGGARLAGEVLRLSPSPDGLHRTRAVVRDPARGASLQDAADQSRRTRQRVTSRRRRSRPRQPS
jgi:DNA-binding winged helix-turn-helix (wHTH) protein